MEESIRVSLATIYNTLHQFTEAGLLREIVVDSGSSYFDTNMSGHHHYFDEASGILEDVPENTLQVTGHVPVPEGKKLKRIDVIVRLQDA